MSKSFARYLPILEWSRTYTRADFGDDLLAALIVTIMLVPQSLAYALLAGLPPEMGIYASIAPIFLYAVFGTSRTLAVGPVAVISLMTAAAIGEFAANSATPLSTTDYVIAAITLAFISGVMLTVMGVLRLGALANFLSHPVIAGFITASGVLIASSQLKHILGVPAQGHTLVEMLASLGIGLSDINPVTAAIGAGSLAFLFWVRSGLKPLLTRMGMSAPLAGLMARAGPVLAVVTTTLLTWLLSLDTLGVKVVGHVPQGLPPLTAPSLSLDMWSGLFASALLISVVGFVESVSVAQTLAAKKRQRIDPNQELIGLGMANIGGSLTGGYPVTGGFARSVVNFDAGAKTPAAGAFTALGLLTAALLLTPLLYYLPQATLAATIIVAVLSLADLSILKRSWAYSRADFFAVAITIIATLWHGVEAGISAGVALSIAIHLFKTSRPHMAVVGRVEGTEHFRNIKRHTVITDPHILTLRVDESLYFANARFLEDKLYTLIADNPDIRHVILMCPAVNAIDLSALESLEAINERLSAGGVTLHLSEVKGPVMDRLKRSDFLDQLTGQIFLSQHDAMVALGDG